MDAMNGNIEKAQMDLSPVPMSMWAQCAPSLACHPYFGDIVLSGTLPSHAVSQPTYVHFQMEVPYIYGFSWPFKLTRKAPSGAAGKESQWMSMVIGGLGKLQESLHQLQAGEVRGKGLVSGLPQI